MKPARRSWFSLDLGGGRARSSVGTLSRCSVGALGLLLATGCGEQSYAPARIDLIAPATGPSTGGPMMTITGANFAEGDLVHIAGEPAPGAVFVSPTELSLPLPPHPGVFGPTPVSVVHRDGQIASRGDLFSYYLGNLQLAARAASAGQGRPFTVRVADAWAN